MYTCLKYKFATVEKKMQSAINLLNKYGYTASYEVVAEYKQTVPVYAMKEDMGAITKVLIENTTADVVEYVFNMPDFKVGDYTPIALIEHVEDGKNLVYAFNQKSDLPKDWWTIPSYCDDCKDKYRRKKTVMLLNNENNTYRQIGLTCLKKYLGISCFNIISNFMLVTEILLDDSNNYLYKEGFGRERIAHVVDTVDFIAAAIERIKTNGYEKYITADFAFSNAKHRSYDENSKNKAEEIIAFFDKVDEDILDNFGKDIKSAISAPYTTKSGLLAYSPIAYEKYKAKLNKTTEFKDRTKSSNFVGEVGEKFTELLVEVLNCVTLSSDYGILFLNTFIDDQGNVYTWTTARSFDIGKKLVLKGTIKAHNTYKGVKQTQITRARVLSED